MPSCSDLTDEELVRLVVAGDAPAFRELATRHTPVVKKVARAVVGTTAADDVLQETLTAAFRRIETYRGPSVRAWLVAIARNASLRFRAKSAQLELTDPTWFELGHKAGWGRETAPAPESQIAVREALALLDSDSREVLILRDVMSFSGEEVCEILALSLPAMKSRLHRARLELMAALGGSHD